MFNIEQKTNALKSMLWVFWLYLFSFIGFITTIIVITVFLHDPNFKQILLLSLLLLFVPYLLGAIMFLLVYKNLDVFDKMTNINKIVKVIAFIPVANIAFLYYYFLYRSTIKKEIKQLEKGNDQK